jgi:hypothetical protein
MNTHMRKKKIDTDYCSKLGLNIAKRHSGAGGRSGRSRED